MLVVSGRMPTKRVVRGVTRVWRDLDGDTNEKTSQALPCFLTVDLYLKKVEKNRLVFRSSWQDLKVGLLAVLIFRCHRRLERN